MQDAKKRFSYRTVFKDPIAIMSIESIYLKYQWDIIILIRHPAAFVASLKMKDWEFDFCKFLCQKELMNSRLKKFSEHINEFTIQKKDIIDQGILLWNRINETIFQYKKR